MADATQPRSSLHTAPAAAPLYADVLHSLFDYLSLRELSRASRVCAQWGRCMRTLPIRVNRVGSNGAVSCPSSHSLTVGLLTVDDAAAMAASPCARRLLSLRVHSPLGLCELQTLSTLPTLLSLDVCAGKGESAAAGVHAAADNSPLLPPSLTSLNLRFRDPALLSPRIIAAAGACPSLRHFALIHRSNLNVPIPELDLSPLCRSRSLTALQLDCVPSDDALTHLRQIPSLRRLFVPPQERFVSMLLEHPPPNLTHLETRRSGVDAAMIDALAHRVPNLAQLPSGYLLDDAVFGLHKLTKLRHLRIQPGVEEPGGDRNAVVDAAPLIASFASCSFLPLLELLCHERLDGLTSAQMLTLTPQLSSLLILQLSALTIDSLSFLTPLRLLRQLHLIACTDELPVAELSHALALPALERMHIAQSPWDCDAVMSLMQPRLPQMRCFAFDGPELRTCCPHDENPLHDLNPAECQMTAPSPDPLF